MGPGRRRIAQRLPEQLLLWRVGQVLLGANYVRDSRRRVINDVGQQERRRTIATGDDEILQRSVLKAHFAPHQVVDDGATHIRSTKPQRRAGGA